MAQSSRNCYCSVPYCSNNKQKFPYLSFHDFPVDPEMRARWVKAIKREEGPSFKIVRASTFVCRQHFTPADIYTTVSGRIRIKQGAVPSRFYWNDWGQGSPSPESVDQRASAAVDDDSEKKLVLGESTEEALCADAVANDHDYASNPFTAYHPPETAALQTCRALPSPQPRLTKYSVDSTSAGLLPEVNKKPISVKEEANHPPEEAAPQTSGSVLRTQPQLFMYYLTGPLPGANKKPITVKEEDKLDIATLRIKELELQVLSLENEIQQLTVKRQQPLIDRFCTTDEDFRYYTRFSSKEVFAGFWESVYPSASRLVYWTKVQTFQWPRSRQKKLPLVDEFFMFLCRVAAGLPEKTLSSIFGVSLSTVSSTISTWTIYLYQVLGSLPVWMTKEQVQATMPHKFKLLCPHARVIIKSTAIHCETASSTSPQSETSSDSKAHTTFKGLIGIAPCGVITFVSKLHTDSISDTEITRRSHILQLLEPGDGVMADSGFLIEEMLSKVGATLIALQLEKSTQLTKEDSCNTQVIPNMRILVERAICRVKEYCIWDGPVPLSMASSVNELWVVCCLMSNYQGPLDIKGNKLV